MPAAERVMQRNVPTVLSFSTHSNLSVGNILISPVALSRDTVRIALPPPAQQTSTRSCPLAARALANAASTDSSLSPSHSPNIAPTPAAAFAPASGFRSKIATLTPAAPHPFSVSRTSQDPPVRADFV